MASQVELTPCGAMFDIFKRAAHLSHIELCGLVLSSRPLAGHELGKQTIARRSARFSSATLPNTVPRLRVLCRNWPCASAIPWTPRL